MEMFLNLTEPWSTGRTVLTQKILEICDRSEFAFKTCLPLSESYYTVLKDFDLVRKKLRKCYYISPGLDTCTNKY